MSDIVERLRRYETVGSYSTASFEDLVDLLALAREAADEIERLRKLVDHLYLTIKTCDEDAIKRGYVTSAEIMGSQ